MNSKVFNFQSIESESQSSEVLEMESFRPHYGNTCVFMISNGVPLITIGPHCIYIIIN